MRDISTPVNYSARRRTGNTGLGRPCVIHRHLQKMHYDIQNGALMEKRINPKGASGPFADVRR